MKPSGSNKRTGENRRRPEKPLELPDENMGGGDEGEGDESNEEGWSGGGREGIEGGGKGVGREGLEPR